MSKSTLLRKVRKFKPEYLNEGYSPDGIPRAQYICPVCGNAMLVSVGQVIKCHKACRTEYKRIVKYQQEHGKI